MEAGTMGPRTAAGVPTLLHTCKAFSFRNRSGFYHITFFQTFDGNGGANSNTFRKFRAHFTYKICTSFESRFFKRSLSFGRALFTAWAASNLNRFVTVIV